MAVQEHGAEDSQRVEIIAELTGLRPQAQAEAGLSA